jgi:hypothetical protein
VTTDPSGESWGNGRPGLWLVYGLAAWGTVAMIWSVLR